MASLVWDALDERSYERGVSHGVLYLPDGSAVVWNGLTSVNEQENKSFSPVFFDGVKRHDIVDQKDFTARVNAITYPSELDPSPEGLNSQMPKRFGFSYQTLVDDGYMIHILHNVLFIQSEIAYNTVNATPSLTEFSWNIYAPRIEVDGYAPMAEVILDSRKMDPDFLNILLETLYGSDTQDPFLPDALTFYQALRDWARVVVTDNGDGTWTASSPFDQYIVDLGGNRYSLVDVNATYLDSDTYQLSNTEFEI